MKEIRGDAKNLRSLLGGSKFAIDYYQREFRWEKKQVTELIDDLSGKFFESQHCFLSQRIPTITTGMTIVAY